MKALNIEEDHHAVEKDMTVTVEKKSAELQGAASGMFTTNKDVLR